MDFQLPAEIIAKLAELDAFIEAEIKPLEREHIQFFDHRREYARTDWENDGRPRAEWRALIIEMERRADRAAGRDACLAPVLDIDEAPQHPHMRARSVFAQFDEVIHPRPAPRFSRTPGSLRRPTPSPDEHRVEVLRDWGIHDRAADA